MRHFFVIFKHCAVLVIRYIRDLSVFLFQEAPILWFTHTKAAVLSCPFYGSPLYAFFCWILKMEAFFRPVDHMIYGDTNVVKVSSQATESSRKSSRFIEKLLCWAKTSRLSRLEMKNRKTKLRTAARDYSAHFSIKIQLLWCSWKWWSKCQKARNRKKAENGSNFKLIYHKQ